MKRLNSKPKDMRSFACPQCGKSRMTRPTDHTVSLEKREYKTKDNSQIELFTDICDFCKARNWTKYFEPTRADIRRVLKAMQDEAKLSEDQSLEDLL